MPKRKITLCEDETFHPQICLVAIEPVSNFLILEAYAEKRDASTWNNAIDTALHPFSVDVIQCVSDEATALLSHAQSHLGVHHLSDVFHVQYEVSKATSLPLNRQNEKTKEAFDLIHAEYQENKAKQAADVFQRSSSCVEGRNGQLSLRHHGLRELTPSKLRALRTIHNYVIQRSDETTSEERFFAIKPRDVIGWLFEHLPMPARPRTNRKQPS